MKESIRQIIIFFSTLLILQFIFCNSEIDNHHLKLIEVGQFSEAERLINDRLKYEEELTAAAASQLRFEIERIARIKKDFTKSENEVVEYIRKFIPDVTDADLRYWEGEKSLEFMLIDGEKHYFKYAARNLFRINPDCREIWKEAHKENQEINLFDLEGHISEVIQHSNEQGKKYVNPVRIRFSYSISVDENTVPKGEIIRCWIPFPREIPNRQENIKLIYSFPKPYKIADNNSYLQHTIYFEKPSMGSEKTRFAVEYEYTAHAVYVPIDSNQVVPVKITEKLYPFLREEPPHVVFTPELKALSEKIVAGEKNPYLIAKRLFAWINHNIPWASAREYSTIRNISQYCHENMHGDCGIKAMLYITLLRMNGIPARWQSGWRFKPPTESMHDWGMVYFEPYGWIPMDVDYGLRHSDDEVVKWFYLHGMDSYRLVFNDAYSQEFSPQKIHFRSETIDSQRGELEWKGGNLYFDQWSWDMDFEILE
jgi:hypothetical protein